MSDTRCDVRMDIDDLAIEDGDIVLDTNEAVIVQNLRHRLIEDGRIYHLVNAPAQMVPEILDHCVNLLEQDEDAMQHTFGWSRERDEIVFSGRLTCGVLIKLPWQVDNDD